MPYNRCSRISTQRNPADSRIALIVHMALLLSVAFAVQNPISHYWHKITDPTFRSVYHANGFDLAMMIPYFIVLLVLAVYGLHRYWLVYDYFDYPAELLDVQVLDDSTDETRDVARACVERHAAQGMPIVYIHRTNREGYKAGALENGLKTSRGEFVAIFDA